MEKLTYNFQDTYRGKNLYNPSVLQNISKSVKIHGEAYENPISSAASCLNVFGSMVNDPDNLLKYLNALGIPATKIYNFPTSANVSGRVYDDTGFIVFEWVGPQKSPINERGGKRGQNRTSIDAYILVEIEGKITQIIIEWKFTEGLSRPLALERFSGMTGVERLRRYSSVLSKMRTNGDFPFCFKDEGGIGLFDFSPDHLYQLLRMTLLARTTTPITIGDLLVEDYRVVHLSHSQNDEINILHGKYLVHSPGLQKYAGQKFHDVWKDLLSDSEKPKFIGAHWDLALGAIQDNNLRNYLMARY